MEKIDYIEYWLKSAEHDLDVGENLFKNGKYDWCLFIGHLVIEKILKAFWVRDNERNEPPWIHNLLRLAEECKIDFSEEQKLLLLAINDFNMETRYPDYKLNFHKKCTKEFAGEYFGKIKELYKWLISQK